MGCALSSASSLLSYKAKASLILVFALSVPIGIVVGMIVSSSSSGNVSKGMVSSAAAGILLYVGLVEMLSEDFGNSSIAKNFGLKARMCAALILGTGSMAVLAIWA